MAIEGKGRDLYMSDNGDFKDSGKRKFPIISTISLIFPALAFLAILIAGAPFLEALFYGFSNLGYLLIFFGIIKGKFLVFGLETRGKVIVFGILIFVVSTVLSNLLFPVE